MGKAAAKYGDSISVSEQHPTVVGNTTSSSNYTFTASINGGLSTNVLVMGQPAAVNGSTANSTPEHKPPVPGGTITPSANNDGAVNGGSTSVLINGKGMARHGDNASGCSNAVPPFPVGSVVVKNVQDVTVFIGD